MKKIICLLVFLCVSIGLHAFDSALIGSWGIVIDNEKLEIIRFSNNELIIMNTVFRQGSFEVAENTIFIDDYDNDSILIQYYLLAPNKLLFIMTDTNRFEQNMTMILSKL